MFVMLMNMKQSTEARHTLTWLWLMLTVILSIKFSLIVFSRTLNHTEAYIKYRFFFLSADSKSSIKIHVRKAMDKQIIENVYAFIISYMKNIHIHSFWMPDCDSLLFSFFLDTLKSPEVGSHFGRRHLELDILKPGTRQTHKVRSPLLKTAFFIVCVTLNWKIISKMHTVMC